MNKLKQERILCRGGLSTNSDTLVLSSEFPGKAEELVNFEVSQFGGYRRIDGYTIWDSSATTLSGTGNTLGVFIYANNVYAARASGLTTGDSYTIFVHTTAVGWSTATNVRISTGSTASSLLYNNGTNSVRRLRTYTHNYLGTETIVITDGVGYPYKYNGTTWTSIDASTGDILGAKYIAPFKNHMFYAGMSGNKNYVVYSAPNTDDNFSAGSGTGVINVGFTVNGLAVFREYLYVFGENIIKRIEGNNASDFALKDITENIGCVAPDSIINLGGEILYMSADGIRTVSGTDKIGDVNLETISEDIKSTILAYAEVYDFNDLVSVIIRGKTQFRYFLFSSADAVADSLGIIGGVRYTSSGLKQWEYGRLLGFKPNCAYSGFINGVEYVLHGDNQGQVFRQESGTSFNGADIVSIYTTPYLDFGNTESYKTFHRAHTFINSEGVFTLYCGIGFDWDDPYAPVPQNFTASVTSITTKYGDPNTIYDAEGVLWDGAGRASLKFDINGGGSAIKLSFVNTSTTDASFSIQGIVYRYTETDSLRGY